jgi:PAS domain-containing protein
MVTQAMPLPLPVSALLEVLPDAVLVVRADGRIAYANNLAERLLAFPAGGLAAGRSTSSSPPLSGRFTPCIAQLSRKRPLHASWANAGR